MKRLISLVLILCCLCGCSDSKKVDSGSLEKEYFFGMWVSCYELEGLSRDDFSKGFEALAHNAKEMGLNALFVHTRAFESCVYESDIFPTAEWCKEQEFDVLQFMIDTSHKYNLKFHAWINPYRLNNNKKAELSDKLSYLKENEDYSRVESGVFLNPASAAAQTMIIDGIKELINKYDIDGIHFDDYFYPTSGSEFDAVSYEIYSKQSQNPINLADFRRNAVNVMISSVSRIVGTSKKDILFSVSPAADIEKNYNELYADVKFWCEEELIDAIIPQIYFGFNYPLEKFSFENLVIEWINCVKDTDVYLYIGLAPYKLGTKSGPDKEEWENGDCVVANQLKNVFSKGEISGISLFSYSALNNNEELYVYQKENIKRQISAFKEEF